MIRRSVATVVIVWCLISAGVFVLSAVVPAWPSWLELPWSGFEDFVVTQRGEVVVYSSYFQQLLVYDLHGRFLASLPVPRSRGDHRLSTDDDGRIYIRRGRTLYVASTLNPEAYDLEIFSDPESPNRGWVLGDEGAPRPLRGDMRFTDLSSGAVRPGEILFVDGAEDRRRFDLASGSRVERTGDRLTVYDTAGRIARLATPGYLYWLKFPMPGAFAWIVAIAYGIAEARVRPWLEGRGAGIAGKSES